jgi:Zn-finger protein
MTTPTTPTQIKMSARRRVWNSVHSGESEWIATKSGRSAWVSSCMQCSLINTSFLSVYHSVIAVNIANFVVAARKKSHVTG